MMKKLPVLLNVLAILAIVGACGTQTAGDVANTPQPSNSSENSVAGNMPVGKIVYFDIDSVMANYEMAKDIAKELADKLNTSEAQLQTKQRAFEKKVKDLQYKAQKQLETRANLAQMEQNLAKEQQELMGLTNQLQYRLAEEEQVSQRKVLDSITEYLKKMEGEHNYQFVFGYKFGGNVFYANKNLDITKEVIEGLNNEYKASKGQE